MSQLFEKNSIHLETVIVGSEIMSDDENPPLDLGL